MEKRGRVLSLKRFCFSLDVVPHSYEKFEKREIGKPVIRLSCLDDDQIDNDGVAGDRILGKL